MGSDAEARLTGVHVTRYRMPLRRAYGTARGVTTAGVNFLVQLTAAGPDGVLEGAGECQPRHDLTGDGGKDRVAAWAFLCAAADALSGKVLRLGSRATALESVRSTMADLRDLAGHHADDSNRDRPFRGTLLGIEVALLDVVARAQGMQIAELLGKRRDEIGISISTISSSTDLDGVQEKVLRQRRFPITRVKGIGDITHDLELLDRVTRANRSAGREKPIWIDINEALDYAGAEGVVGKLVERMGAGDLPAAVILEGMLPKSQVGRLPELQRLADAQCRATGADLDLRIMPDEGMWDVDDLARLQALGGCRAINIKAPKAGGLLASLELAEAAVAAGPDIHICIGGMVGTSDVTAWALHNLARALPRIDYLTAVPPQNVEARITDPLARFAERGSNIIAAQTSPGLGTRVVPHQVAPYVENAHEARSGPEATGTAHQTGSRPILVPDVPARTLVFGGDTSLGDVYVRRQEGELARRLEHSPMSFFDGIRPLVADSDAVILNLETVLSDAPSGPFEGRKPYLGWDSPARTIGCLQELGVRAVSLANNHTMDYGERHLLDSRSALEKAAIGAFGAGASRAEAAAPLTLTLDFEGTERRIHVIGAMEVQARLRDEFGFYAEGDHPGVNPMHRSRIAALIESLRKDDPTALIVVFPHWGRNYQWASERQRRAADELRRAGADLIIGHGAHTLQECAFTSDHAVVYSLGNFLFNWGGRFTEHQAPPYGLVARVEVAPWQERWVVTLRLYPIAIDNRATGHRPAPVDAAGFAEVCRLLRDRDADQSFGTHASPEQDARGHHIAFTFTTSQHGPSRHPVDRPPARPASLAGAAGAAGAANEPNRYEDPDTEAIRNQLDRRMLGPLLVAREAERDGATITWLGSDTFLAKRAGRELLFHRHRCTESVVAGRLVQDKALVKRLLDRVFVPTPAGGVAHSLDEAARLFQALGKPSVVKPVKGDRGAGVTVGVTDEAGLVRAYDAAASPAGVIVEELVPGEELRCVATTNEFVGSVGRDAPNVVGDGVRNLRELIEAKNAYRKTNPNLRNRPIVIDDQLIAFVERNGGAMDSVPTAGDKVYVGRTANITVGGDSVDVADTVPDLVRRTAVDAVRAVPGLDWGGVDIILDRTGNGNREPRAVVLEINVNAGIGSFHYPVQGRPRNIARQAWRQRLATSPPPLSKPHHAPARMSARPAGDGGTGAPGAMLAEYAAANGWSAEWLAPTLLQVSKGHHRLVFYGCASTSDRALVAHVLRRRGILKALLERGKVRTVPGQVVRSADELWRLATDVATPTVLFPVRGRTGDSLLAKVESLPDRNEVAAVWERIGHRRVFAQARPAGTRLRVIASRSDAFVMLGTADAASVLGAERAAWRDAARLAVSAVRAVPELRWAAVDLLRWHDPAAPGNALRFSVEGLAMEPSWHESDQAIDGSFEAFFEALLTPSSGRRRSRWLPWTYAR